MYLLTLSSVPIGVVFRYAWLFCLIVDLDSTQRPRTIYSLGHTVNKNTVLAALFKVRIDRHFSTLQNLGVKPVFFFHYVFSNEQKNAL